MKKHPAGTFPSTSAISEALGGKERQPEKSTNLSVGTVIRLDEFDLTVDAYRIHIRHQRALSEVIQQSSSQSALIAVGRGQCRLDQSRARVDLDA